MKINLRRITTGAGFGATVELGYEVQGLTLRDLFAMAVASGFLADPGLRFDDAFVAHNAAAIYRMADAMIAAREAKE